MKYVFDTNTLFIKGNIKKYVNNMIPFKINGSISKYLRDGNGFISPTIFAEIINQILIEKKNTIHSSIDDKDRKKYENLFEKLIKKVTRRFKKYVLVDVSSQVIPDILTKEIDFLNKRSNFKNIKDKVIAYEVASMKKIKKWDNVTIVTDNIRDFNKHPDIDQVIRLTQFVEMVSGEIIKFENESELFKYVINVVRDELKVSSSGLGDFFTVSKTKTMLQISSSSNSVKFKENLPLSKKELTSLVGIINNILLEVAESMSEFYVEHYGEYQDEHYREYEDEHYREYEDEQSREFYAEQYREYLNDRLK